jgi:hypothetical protein
MPGVQRVELATDGVLVARGREELLLQELGESGVGGSRALRAPGELGAQGFGQLALSGLRSGGELAPARR